MDLGLGQGHRDAQYAAMAALRDADGDQHRTIDPLSRLADPLVPGIEQEVWNLLIQRPLAPDGQTGV